MAINLLDQNTINKIAAGEVVDRPSSVVKELIENAIDAGAAAITVEIKDGGTSLIRITDNGHGIEKSDIKTAFLRHSTSKIKDAADLASISSLGFRGEALSSICAVAQVELITKTKEALTGIRYQIDGGEEKAFEEVGAPDGTTFLVRNLFYNTPARRKFLKTPSTEGGYISALVEHMCLSRPDISFRFIMNGQPKIQTAGNGNLKDVIYTVYGREITGNIVEVHREYEKFKVDGFIGKPAVSRGNRNFENYYINNRYIKSGIISKAIEEAFAPFLMLHKYPFTVLHITIEPEQLDVNVHPSKMEIRFANQSYIFDSIKDCVNYALTHKELIPDVEIKVEVPEPKQNSAASFTKAVTVTVTPDPVKEFTPLVKMSDIPIKESVVIKPTIQEEPVKPVEPVVKEPEKIRMPEPFETKRSGEYQEKILQAHYKQLEFFEQPELLQPNNLDEIRILGQIFKTFWVMQFENKMYLVDQHAAHEKVLYEKFKKQYEERSIVKQLISPPVIISLTKQETQLLKDNLEFFKDSGFEIEEFGNDEYAISGIPADFSQREPKELFMEIIDQLSDDIKRNTPASINHKIATMACKAAVKGNTYISQTEAEDLIKQLMTLENPYNCPHGRPTMITMSKYEIEKKFKRIV